KGKTFTFGGFTAPQVPAGTYRAVMKKGKDTYEHSFELVYDKNSPLSKADRDMKNRITMELYDMVQELAYFVYEIDEMIAKMESDDNKKMLAKLNTLKESLVITTGDNYVGSAEPQLREKMTNLYSKVASSYDKPTKADFDNLQLITERFDKAKADYAKLKKKIKGLEGISLMSFETFLESK
ncbi:MAG: hypothetical protein KJP14_03295, partial [Eudoraea sp.]|nr:hypothetical protein [Eudoraea sp.]